ncbi:DUF6268 family outer membrane beta-barrel protein [Ohtaekwangia koreensis]|uniref:DUF6268 domain-containing protein n=1 Tax=Ohtaekwangia koreensis TaxID=688867 RepID=A0A1T5M5I9_9BACT|nr:DUF6268 family outer membrane beta-barrel protein [Ohtaekwangia koreensis]SKC83395.1 hypothetical protein SAMN05660236_4443 [Ohtaekwangia koreensis]
MEANIENRKMFRSAIAALFMLALSGECFAQSGEAKDNRQSSQRADTIVHKKFITTSPRLGGVTVTNTFIPVKADGNTFTIQMPTVDIGIPVYKNFRTKHPVLVKAGIRYQGLILSDERKIGSNAFHSISIPVLFSYSITRATNLTLISSTSVNSDYKQDIEEQDILYTVGVRIGFHQDRKFKYGITPTYTKGYSGTFLLPIIDIDWTINKRLTLTAILPARATLKYKVSEIHSLGATVWIGGNNMYRLNEAEKEQYIHLRQNNAGLLYEAKLGQRWKLNLTAGYTLMQKLETFDIDQKISLNKFNDLNHRRTNVAYHEKSFVVQTGISYQF